MKHGTAIEWTHLPGYKGETWNPWVGCSAVSDGCKNCFACRQANRFKNTHPQYEGTVRDGNWMGRVNRAPDPQFYAPINWHNPRAIFVNSMSDFFHEGADEFREFAWHTIHQASQHLYLILTKRPERIPECLPSFGKKEWPWPNVWLGASVENQEMADKRVPELLRVPAAKQFLSLEPLLGPVDLMHIPWLPGIAKNALVECADPAVSWVIVGGESGPGARPMHPDWTRGIQGQCQAAGVPFFFKQWGAWAHVTQTPGVANVTNDSNVHEWEGHKPFGFSENYSVRVGKKLAGRLLDGRTWEEFPV